MVHLDDIVIISKTIQEHITHPRIVSTVLLESVVRMKLKKSPFFMNRIVYFCHVLKPGRFKVVSHTADAIPYLKVPTVVTELHSVRRLCSVSRRFVSNFVRTASLLFKQLKETQEKELGQATKQELNTLEFIKQRLISPALATLPKRKEKFTLDIDTFYRQVSCVLLWKQEKRKGRPI